MKRESFLIAYLRTARNWIGWLLLIGLSRHYEWPYPGKADSIIGALLRSMVYFSLPVLLLCFGLKAAWERSHPQDEGSNRE